MSTREGRKITGGKYIARRKKRRFEDKGQARIVKLGEEKRKNLRLRGGNLKTVMLKGKTINVKGQKLEIKNVVETPSDRFLARQNIITKGTIVETEKGRVRVTNRPSQEGVINGVQMSK
jgi:small subunit ribosomal protein S8e